MHGCIVFNTLGCRAEISGPFNSEGIPLLVSVLETNETHPAVVRCHVTCLNQQGIYRPAMALIITNQERFISVHGSSVSSIDGLYEIRHGNVSYCEAQNNYTMEFEYLIYSNSSLINHAIVACGVVHLFTNPPCWGQSYGIIRYTELSPTTITSDSNLCPLTSTVPLPTILPTDQSIIVGLRVHDVVYSALLSVITILVIIVVTAISVSFAFGLLYLRSRKKIAIIEEQPLVMKMVHNKGEQRLQKDSEELPAEGAGNPSPTHTELNQKLPDKISSRDSKC